MKKILSKIKNIKKLAGKRPRLFIVSCLAGVVLIEGTAFAVIHTVQMLNNHTTKPAKTAASTKPHTSKTLSPSPSKSAEPTPTPSTQATAQTTQKSTSSKPPGWYWPTKETQECNKKMNDAYVKYNADLKAENIRHQAALAALQAAYDNGEYNDPYLNGAPNDYIYQLDVDAENSQWQTTITAINDTERAAMDALYPC